MPAESTPAGPRAYLPALDGLRAVAVLLVMAEHLRAFAFPSSRLLPPGGYLGVDLFFVLSGFLITSLLLSEREQTGGISFRRFYRRRAFRLLPALGAFIVVQAAAAATAGQSLRDEVHFWIGAVTYTTNWVVARNWSVPANTSHMWSLAVEEQFYVFWPIVLLLAWRRWGRNAVPVVCIGGALVALVSRVYFTHRFGIGFPWVYLHTETRLDSLLLGGLLGYAHQRGWQLSPRVTRAVGWAGAAVVAWYVLYTTLADDFLYSRGGYTVLAIAATAVVAGLLDPRWTLTRVLSTRPMVAIGRLSYSIYLWHMLVLFVLLSFLQRQSVPVAIVVFLGATLVMATLSFRLVESPLRSLGSAPDRERARRAPAAPRRARRPWVLAGAGGVALTALAVVPAYAARHDILGRDEAVAAAVAKQSSAATSAAASVAAVDVPATTVATVDTTAAAASTPAAIPSAGSPTTTVGRDAVVLTVLEPTVATVAPGEVAGVRFAATLARAGGAPLTGRVVHFSASTGSCDATTDATGTASCSVTPAVAVPPATTAVPNVVNASYDGDATTEPASAAWP